MNSTKITRAQISARLRAAGFEASRQTTTAVRGWYNFSAGYVTADASKWIIVRYRGSRNVTAEKEREVVNLYASALLAQGFNVDLSDDGTGVYVSAAHEEVLK